MASNPSSQYSNNGEEQQYHVDYVEYENQDLPEGIDDIKDHDKQTLEKVPADELDDGKEIVKAHPEVKNMSILVVGKTGSGKSTLINSVFGEKVATERRGVTAQAHDVLELHQRTIAGIDISFFDTRGLCDPDISNQEFVSQLSKYETLQIDLVLVCIKITERIDEGTITAINDISRFFGDKFWKHSIFLLTFSNRYEQELKEDDDEIDENTLTGYVQSEVHNVAKLLRKKLELQKDPSISDMMDTRSFTSEYYEYDHIPFINVGRIRKGKEDTDIRLSTSDNWVNDMLECCIRRCNEQIRPSMIRAAAECVGMTLGYTVLSSAMYAGIGAVIGGVVGTIFFPGFGTASSAAVGAQWGAGIAAGFTTTVMPIGAVMNYFNKGKLEIKKTNT